MAAGEFWTAAGGQWGVRDGLGRAEGDGGAMKGAFQHAGRSHGHLKQYSVKGQKSLGTYAVSFRIVYGRKK